jgi:hypothetical protein
MTKPMSLEEWRATAERVSVREACDRLGVDIATYQDSVIEAIWLYGCLYIEEMNDGSFYCLIENIDRIDQERKPLEDWLYFEWAVSEAMDQGKWTMGQLCVLLDEFAQWSGIALDSADEMILKPGAEPHRAWLAWYIRTWGQMEGRAIEAASA